LPLTKGRVMLRVGAVSYLNTRPLIYGLHERLQGIGTLSLNLPSRLADDLSRGSLDVALIPSIEYFRGGNRGYRIISDAAIACRGPVWSVRLLSRVPVQQIQTLALDVGSRTSAALVRLLMQRVYNIDPHTLPLALEQLPETVDADAVLLIGDRAMHPPAGIYHEIIDLGQWWNQLTGLPFVFAMWVARAGIDCQQLEAILGQCRDDGLQNVDEIARLEAGPNGLTIIDLRRYLTEHLHFYLGSDECLALNAYREGVTSAGLLDALPDPAPVLNTTTHLP
jgi:chorismate dehydratase